MCLFAGVAACNAIFGVDDFTVADTGGGRGMGGDAGAPNTACLANEVMACYEGPEATENVGACRAGTKTCLEDGSGFGPCVGQVVPTLDDCTTSTDEDCNNLYCGEPIWSRTFSDNSPGVTVQRVVDVASDDAQIVATGRYQGALRVGGTLLPGDTTDDGFVASMDPLGNLSWLVRIGGLDDQRPLAIALDGSDNAYVVGTFVTEVRVGMHVLPGPVDRTSAFVLKLSDTGEVVWLQALTSTGPVTLSDVAVAEDGHVQVVGTVVGDLDLGGTIIAGGAVADWLVLSLGSTGGVAWATHHDATMTPHAVATSGGVTYVAGKLAGTVSLGVEEVTASGPNDGVVVAYDASGAVTSHRLLPGTALVSIQALALLDGDLIAAGSFGGDVELGDGLLRTATDVDAFVARYGPDLATTRWALAFGGAATQRVEDVTVDALTEIALVGVNTGELALGAVAHAGGTDAFVAKLDAEGSLRFVTSYGDASDDVALGVAVQPTSRNLFVVGYFAGDITFGTTTHTALDDDGFIVKVGP